MRSSGGPLPGSSDLVDYDYDAQGYPWIAYGRCLAECAVIESALAALGVACPPTLVGAAATCAGDCLNPINWLPGSKIFKKGKQARDLIKNIDRANDAKKAAKRADKLSDTTKATQRGTRNQKVAEAAKKGRKIHKDYDYGPGFEKEVTLPSEKRADAVNWETREVVELKPNNPNAVRRGEKQVERYRQELESITGESWTSRVETYD